MRLFVALLSVLIFLSIISPVHAADEEERLRNMAEQLIQLRGEVDDLNNRLNDERAQHSQQLRSLASRKNDLVARIEQEQLTIEKLKKSLVENKQRALEAGADASVLKPVLIDAVDKLEAQINAGLPFKINERMKALNEYRKQVEAGVLPPQKAANRLWSFMEDELRLTRENGIFRQTIDMQGKEILVDVARLGMVLMYFRTQEDEFGVFKNDSGEWSPVMVSDGNDKAQIDALFTALQKQIRTGYFVLPNAL